VKKILIILVAVLVVLFSPNAWGEGNLGFIMGGDEDGDPYEAIWRIKFPNGTTTVSNNVITVTAGTGDVVGPASSVDENITVYDSTTGKLLKDSGVNISALEAIDTESELKTNYSLEIGVDVEAADTEGSLPNESVVSADVKDATLVEADHAPASRTVHQDATVADGGTLTPTAGYKAVYIDLTPSAAVTDVIMSETGVIADCVVFIRNVDANSARFSDSANVLEMPATTYLAQYETLILIYSTDRWLFLSVGTASPSFASIDQSNGTLTLPTTTSGDQTLTVGMVGVKTDEDYIAVHGGGNGQVQTEVAIPLYTEKNWSFDPDGICDLTTDRLFLMKVDHPHGITIIEWEVSFDVDPTTEWGAGETLLKRADAFIGVGSSATIDDLATTSGVSSESTLANINSGAAIADGKVVYIDFPTAYTEALHQVYFRMKYKIEED